MSAREPGPGDNEVGGVAADRLRSICDRYIHLDEEKKALSEDQADIMVEAASAGFDKKVVRKIIAIMKREPAEVENEEALLQLYRSALGV